MVVGCSQDGGGYRRMKSMIKNENSRAASYKRITSQCVDAKRQIEKQTISMDVAAEIIRLARLLLKSIDLHCQRSPKTTLARDHRTQAQNALRQLRSAIRKIN